MNTKRKNIKVIHPEMDTSNLEIQINLRRGDLVVYGPTKFEVETLNFQSQLNVEKTGWAEAHGAPILEIEEIFVGMARFHKIPDPEGGTLVQRSEIEIQFCHINLMDGGQRRRHNASGIVERYRGVENR